MEIAILCGGKGKRMGNTNKGLLKLCNKTFVEVLNEEFKDVGRVFIIGRKNDFKDLEIEVYDDIIPDLGPMGGIYTALSLSQDDNVLFVPCDMPTFKKEHAIYLEKALKEDYAEVSIFYTDRITPIPGIYKKILKDSIRNFIQNGRLSLTDFVKEHKTVISIVKDLGYFKNINTQKDYEELLSAIKCT